MWRWRLLLLLRHRKEEPRYSIRFESFMFSQTWCHNTVLGCTLSTDRLINWLGMAIYMEKNVYLYTHKPTQQMHMYVYVRKKFRGTDHIVHNQMIYYYSTDFEFKLDIKSVRNQCANIVFRFHWTGLCINFNTKVHAVNWSKNPYRDEQQYSSIMYEYIVEAEWIISRRSFQTIICRWRGPHVSRDDGFSNQRLLASHLMTMGGGTAAATAASSQE